VSLDEHQRRERAQAIGMFRYQLICPALDAGSSSKQRRAASARSHDTPRLF
jgi:putative transposase